MRQSAAPDPASFRVNAISRSRAGRFSSDKRSWRELARASGSIAIASPQSSFAPPAPNRPQRRKVSSSGAPSSVPSQPSIG